ncbi:MAG: hypothetical protein JKY99_08010 [Rhizobiales bacterium]|nr:hypothetical protein [Hyphomicrobiales bacterium]
MCRMLLATGDFPIEKTLNAAISMAQGKTCPHPAPSNDHPHGFGLVWSDPEQPTGYATFKCLDPLGLQSASQLMSQAGPSLIRTRLLAVHARYATRPRDMGQEFSHPLEVNTAQGPSYFMHNGFLPFAYQHLGLPESRFDTAEYFQLVRTLLKAGSLEQQLTDILEPMGKPGSAANMIFIDGAKARVFNWWPQGHKFSDYFRMQILKRAAHTIISSDVLPDLAPHSHWRAMARGAFITIGLDDDMPTNGGM